MQRDEVAILATRAGLRLSDQELEEATASYERLRAQVDALRARLDQVEEPALTFQAGVR